MYSEMRRPTYDEFYKVLSDPVNSKFMHLFTDPVIAELCQSKNTIVILVNNVPSLVGGMSVYWPGRGTLWALFTSHSKRNFVPVFRLMRKFVDSLDIKRIELDSPYGDQRFERRAELLGFTKYADRARHFNVDGEDCTLFERIN